MPLIYVLPQPIIGCSSQLKKKRTNPEIEN